MKRPSFACLLLVALSSLLWAAGSPEPRPITWVWLPGDAPPESAVFRAAMEKIVSDAAGRPVEEKLTTDYAIAVQAMATGKAAIALLGPYQYAQARQLNPKVRPIIASSGPSGTLDDAAFSARLVVRAENAASYLGTGQDPLDALAGRVISFVSSSSTAGFVVPAAAIAGHFGRTAAWSTLAPADLAQGGDGRLFNKVLFGGTHQGSVVNVLSGRADVAACNDTDIDTYVERESGAASARGTVYRVRADAPEPFAAWHGARITVIWSVPVPNQPLVVNTDLLSPDEVRRIVAAFTSDAAAQNKDLFVQPGSSNKADFKQTGKVRFLPVDDSTYSGIRALLP